VDAVGTDDDDELVDGSALGYVVGVTVKVIVGACVVAISLLGEGAADGEDETTPATEGGAEGLVVVRRDEVGGTVGKLVGILDGSVLGETVGILVGTSVVDGVGILDDVGILVGAADDDGEAVSAPGSNLGQSTKERPTYSISSDKLRYVSRSSRNFSRMPSMSKAVVS
jgi:hypothetical protein